jgi:hypothetical protein
MAVTFHVSGRMSAELSLNKVNPSAFWISEKIQELMNVLVK